MSQKPSNAVPILEIKGVSKRYGTTQALQDVSLTLNTGTIHGIVGENGAGKSTLSKILAGLVKPDTGEITVNGNALRLGHPKSSADLGIAVAHQQQMLAPSLTVAQNVLLNRQLLATLGRIVSQKQFQTIVEKKLASIGIENISPDTRVSQLSLPDRNRLEIAKALIAEPKILVLDEPTGALSIEAVQWLHDVMHKLSDTHVTIIYISHRIQEILEQCDVVTVMGGGRSFGTQQVKDTSAEEIIALIASSGTVRWRSPSVTIKQANPSAKTGSSTKPALEARNISYRSVIKSVTLRVHSGRITGIAALDGQGQRELFEILFGLKQPTNGSLEMNGKALHLSSPKQAIKAGVGLCFVPEDCQQDGVIPELNAVENVTLPVLTQQTTFGILLGKRERVRAAGALKEMNVKMAYLDDAVSQLSGGNQQKIAIAKWHLSGSQIMLMFDPTRGVDPLTKQDIFTLMKQYVNNGGSILFYSTDLQEILTVTDSFYVLYRGVASQEIETRGIDSETLTNWVMTGAGSNDGHETVEYLC